jgi:hypothetical protein
MSNAQPAAAPLVLTPSERVLVFGDRFSAPAGIAHVEQMLRACEQQRPQLWAALTRTIKAGINLVTGTDE